jgi:hypothetical protein
MRQQGIIGWRGVRAGSCRAWALPADETCAGIARRLFKDSVAQLGLESGVLDDAVLMTSELAANTLHATAAVRTEPPDDGKPPVPGCPEMWLYLRGLGMRRELVCKVFDCYRGWLHGPPSTPAVVPAQAAGGRGLQIVHELSEGRWGHHPTRARLGGWGLRGKAVWFAVPAPFAHARLADVTGLRAYTRSADVTAARRHERISARQAARELQGMLDERGFSGSGPGLVRSDEPAADLSVLSVCRGLTLWCRSGAVTLTGPDGFEERWSFADLVEAAEQTIRRYEELDPYRPEAAASRTEPSPEEPGHQLSGPPMAPASRL